jgi:hypothetical protein
MHLRTIWPLQTALRLATNHRREAPKVAFFLHGAVLDLGKHNVLGHHHDHDTTNDVVHIISESDLQPC